MINELEIPRESVRPATKLGITYHPNTQFHTIFTQGHQSNLYILELFQTFEPII